MRISGTEPPSVIQNKVETIPEYNTHCGNLGVR